MQRWSGCGSGLRRHFPLLLLMPSPNAPGDMPKVLEGWSTAIEAREKFSPLAACWTSEIGGLNKFVHTWVYKDLTERTRVREASRQAGGAWPPQTWVRPIRQDNKLLVPAAFSPVR